MHFNIAQKIFGIAAIVLVMMAAVAIYSIQVTSEISKNLRLIATEDIPTSQSIGHINVRILEQFVILQRLSALEGNDEVAQQAIQLNIKRFEHLRTEITNKFTTVNAILSLEGEATLLNYFKKVEKAYLKFESFGQMLVQFRINQDHISFDSLAEDLDDRQDAIDQKISNLYFYMSKRTREAVQHTYKQERNLLMVNSLLTAVAAIFALCFAAIVAHLLVRAVRALAIGAEAVQSGNLDVEVPVTTNDEVGRLTNDFNSMVEGLRLKERIKDTFGKYMDPRIVTNLLDNPEFSKPGGERREMSVMFIDLQGFTAISEALEPDDLVAMVNDFFSLMTDAISNNNGVVDKYMGDAVMAYWGEPFCAPGEHARLACQAAREARSQLEVFRQNVRSKLGEKVDGLDIDLRIGVSSGEMIVGTIGSTVSRNFTVMGDPVNLGSRLEGANKAYGTRILLSDRTRELVGQSLNFREIDIIRVKGKSEPIRVHELLNDKAQSDNYSAALLAYRNQDWDVAETEFRQFATDPAAQVYLKRIAYLRTTQLPSDWNGVWVFETK